jgi:hypothetical protein
MPFEEQLSQAFDTLTARLRAEIDQEVERRTAEVVAAMPAPATRDEPEPVAASAPAFDAESAARLTEALRSIEAARSLTDILDALLRGARAEAGSADIWLMRGDGLHQWRTAESMGAVHDTPSGSLNVPITIAGSPVAMLYADVDAHGTAHAEQRTSNIEFLTRYAARSLEALTAFTMARALTERPADADVANDAPVPADAATAEEDTSALRYARLLVSEIKLYHEAAVVEGRRDRDLATRLGGEIARARVMYEQRVPPHIRARADYFQDELVRTLANGDSSLLEVRS